MNEPLTAVSHPLALRDRVSAQQDGVSPKDKAREIASEFEAFFLSQILDQMFKGIKSDGMFGGGVAEGAYRELLNEEYAKVISRAGGIGVADAVYREILRLQEVEE